MDFSSLSLMSGMEWCGVLWSGVEWCGVECWSVNFAFFDTRLRILTPALLVVLVTNSRYDKGRTNPILAPNSSRATIYTIQKDFFQRINMRQTYN